MCLKSLHHPKFWSSSAPELRGKLREANLRITQYMDKLCAASAKMARIKVEHGVEVARLKEEHAAGIAKLEKEHAANIARVKDAAAKEVQEAKANAKLEVMAAENHNFKRLAMVHTKGAMDMKKLVLIRFPNLDDSMLQLPELEGG